MACDCKTTRGWNMSVNDYASSQHIVIEDGCFAVMVIQNGDTFFRTNGIPQFPSTTPATALGDVLSFAAHLLDVYRGRLEISFALPLGAAPRATVVQLFYTDAGRPLKT